MKLLQRYKSLMGLLAFFIAVSCVARSPDQPQLLVLLSIDQMRPDRLSSNMPGGLGRLMRDGYVFENATLDHALTNTCPGHVVMSTGRNPANTGIASNSFIDHETGKERYCVDDLGSDNVVLYSDETRSPRAITKSTLSDWLKSASPDSRVYAVSGKDRAAITMGGHRADGVFWFHQSLGRFTTSSYYMKALPAYIEALNGDDFFSDGFGVGVPARWEHAAGSYRPDDFVGEGTMHLRVSGHPLNTGASKANQFYFSPYLDLATGELVRRIVVEEELGKRGVTDFLAVSFSATDVIGHLYGPFSAESEDGLAHLDAEIARLLDLLDEQTGGNYILALSADHGVQPLPEWQSEQNDMKCPVGNGRIDVSEADRSLHARAITALKIPPGEAQDLIGISPAGLTINVKTATELGLDVDEVVSKIEEIFEADPVFVAAWTQAEILGQHGKFARLYRNSMIPGITGHIMPQAHEDCLVWRPEGTTHGSPWLYDRAVPLIFFGRGIRSGRSNSRAHSIDMAPTLGRQAGLVIPDDLDGTVRKEVFEASD